MLGEFRHGLLQVRRAGGLPAPGFPVAGEQADRQVRADPQPLGRAFWQAADGPLIRLHGLVKVGLVICALVPVAQRVREVVQVGRGVG